MVRAYLKLAAAVLVLAVVAAVPQSAISQKQIQTAAGTGNSGIEAGTSDGISLDELKKWRLAAENAGDLADDVKKSVLSYLDRAIIFREREAQFRQEAEDIRQRVKAAPERIKAIEAELDRTLPPPN